MCHQERPYHSDSTASRLLSEVKHCRARLVLRWGTTLESLVLFFCHFWTFCSSPCPHQETNHLKKINYHTPLVYHIVLSFTHFHIVIIYICCFCSLLIIRHSKSSLSNTDPRAPSINIAIISFLFIHLLIFDSLNTLEGRKGHFETNHSNLSTPCVM